MSESSHSTGGTGPSHRTVEIGVALFMALLARDRHRRQPQGRHRLGRRRAEGRLLSVLHLADRADLLRRQSGARLREFTGREVFAEWGQLRQVLSVVIPTTVYVVRGARARHVRVVGPADRRFMSWIGRYSWPMVLAIAIGVPILTYITVRALVPGAAAQGAAGRLARAVSDSDGSIEDIGNLFHGFAVVLQPYNIMLMVLGIVLGVIIGVLPGLGGANGIAILLPLTFSMSPTSAIIMLSCIYWGALFGGAITSILFNIPGEPWSVATTFDGHPMAQQGKAGEALTAAFTSSFVGALFAVIMITLLAPLVASFALRVRTAGNLLGLFPRLLQLRRHEQGAAVQDHRRDDARLRARRRRPRSDDRAACA